MRQPDHETVLTGCGNFKERKEKENVSRQILNTQIIREDIHSSLENYIKSKKISADTNKARMLENYFQKFFQYFRTPKNNIASSLNPLTKQDRAVLLGQNIPPTLFDFYDISDEKMSSTTKGNLFETRLAEVIEKLFQANTPIQVGSQQVTTGIAINAKEASLPGNMKIIVPKAVNNGVMKYIKMTLAEAKQQGYNMVYPAGVSGLVDLSVPNSTITINYQLTPFLKTFIHLLKGAQITAKSYTSMTSISTGRTGTYRIMSSVLPMIGHKDKIKYMAALYTTKTKDAKTNKEKAQHLSHLVFAYQIFGMGQYVDIQGRLQHLKDANFLVVFDRGNQTIRVRSTANLAYQYVVEKKGGIARYPVINLLKM